jgi:elongation of very long chain fatty acids protein 6
MRAHPMLPVGACVLYGVLICMGQYAMRNCQSWNWRRTMAFWNLGLSVFSWIGMARTLPQLLHNLYYMSVRDNLCMDRKYCRPIVLKGKGSSAFSRRFQRVLSHFGILRFHRPARSTYGSGSTGLWVQLFILSKFP